MTHLTIAAMAGFIFTFGATEVSLTPEVVKISLSASGCSEAGKKPAPLPIRATPAFSETKATSDSDIICGSVSLDDQDQPRCNLQLIA